jgi:TatA/E family protein of Tat protein translocase
MGSLSFSEIVVIVLVILIVFGPNRLPELARKAGELMNKVRNASNTMTDALGVDYEETVEPFKSAKRDFDSIKTDISKTVTTFGQAVTLSDANGTTDDDDQQFEGSTSAERDATLPLPAAEESAVDETPEVVADPEKEPPDNSTAPS